MKMKSVLIHIETGASPAYGVHQENDIFKDFCMLMLVKLAPQCLCVITGSAENKARSIIVVQTDENQVQPTTEGNVPMAHIEAGANSAYGVLQENFRL